MPKVKKDYPKMLYQKGVFDAGFSVGQQLHKIVDDPEQEIDALSDGWFSHQTCDPDLNEYEKLEPKD